jgi:hypothetical protein
MSLLRMAFRAWAPALAFVLLSFAAAPVASNHVQTDSGKVIVFDHKAGGNAYWVEVILSGQDAGSVSGVQVQTTSGATYGVWTTMQKNQWGAWQASFQIPAGNDVRFKASWAGGAQQVSCWFTHPEGVEKCGGSTTPFDVFFGLVKGNEWWVQTDATSTGGTIAGIDVRLNAGPWMPLKKQSWQNGWAASYHIVDGTLVQLRATSTTGATDLSNCFKWIPPQTGGQNAQEIPCTSSVFDAKFGGVQGNEWWVQTTVTGNQPIAKVQARDSPGPWKDLAAQSWQNGWGASFHIPAGENVQLRAQSTGGQWDYSANGWTWPGAFVYPDPVLGTDFDAIFEEVSTDAGWVQVNVYADEGTYGLARVDVRVNDGAWSPLARQSWGDWAKAMTPGAGADVQFRAVAKTGQVAESGVYSWPGAMASAAWPQAGSFVTYDLYSKQSGGGSLSQTDAVMRLSYVGSRWNAVCTGTTTEEGDGQSTTTEWTYTTVQGPRQVSPNFAPGTTTNPRLIAMPAWGGTCEVTEWIIQVGGEEWHESAMMRTDDPYVLRALTGTETADQDYQSLDLSWEKRLGLVLDWTRAGHMTGTAYYEGHLVGTDAPIA